MNRESVCADGAIHDSTHMFLPDNRRADAGLTEKQLDRKVDMPIFLQRGTATGTKTRLKSGKVGLEGAVTFEP